MSTPALHLVKPAPPRTLSGRLPPSDTHTEADVLGELLTHPGLVPIARGILTHEDFFEDSHRVVCHAIFVCHELVTTSGLSVEQVTPKLVVSWIKDRDLVQRVVAGRHLEGYVGGNTPAKLEHYLETLRLRPSCLVDFGARCERVKGKARMRDAGRELDLLLAEVTGDYGDDVQRWLDGAVNRLRAVAGAAKAEELIQVGDAFSGVTLGDKLFAGLSTGVPRLNVLTGGFQGGQCWTVTAPPGGGKTAYLLDRCIDIAETRYEVASDDETDAFLDGVLLFSHEMPEAEVALRSACRLASVDVGKAMNHPGRLTARELHALDAARERLSKIPLFIDFRQELSIETIRGTAERLSRSLREQGRRLALVGIDYFQLLGCPEDLRDRKRTRAEELDVTGKRTITMAKELKIPVILLAQLTKCGTNIADCSSLRKHTQNWLNIKLAKGTAPDDDDEEYERVADAVAATFHIRKQRNGRGLGRKVSCWFHGAYQRFDEEQWLPRVEDHV